MSPTQPIGLRTLQKDNKADNMAEKGRETHEQIIEKETKQQSIYL